MSWEPIVKPKRYPEVEVLLPPGVSRPDAVKIASKALKAAGVEEKIVNRFQVECIKAVGYMAAMRVIMEWVTVKL